MEQKHGQQIKIKINYRIEYEPSNKHVYSGIICA